MFRSIGINAEAELVDGHLATLERLLQTYRAVGFDAVELSCAGLGCIRGGELIRGEAERARALLSGYGLHLSMHAPNELSLLRGPLHLRVMDAVLDLAHFLGCTCVVYHSAQIALHDPARHLAPLPDDDELAAMWARETERLLVYGRRAAALGLTLAVENRDPHLWEMSALGMHGRPASDLAHYHQGMRLDLLARQMQDVGLPNVGICLDVGHAYLANPYCAGRAYLAAIEACAPWVRHVHLHDNFGRIDDVSCTLGDRLVFGEADTHMPPGWGSIPLREVLGALQRAGYDGDLVLEIRSRYHEYLGEALRGARRILSELEHTSGS